MPTTSARRVGFVSTIRRLAVVACGAAALVACGDDGDGGDASRFCGEIEANRDRLVEPGLTFSDDVEPLLELYRSIGEFAPLAIEQEWDQLVVNYETASTVVPGDSESEQLAVATALQSEESAATVSRWLRDNCGIDLGPVATVVPQS